MQRYYAWLDKTAAYTRDTPAGHVSVRPWVLTAVLEGYSRGTMLTGVLSLPQAQRAVAVNERMGRLLAGVLSPYIANVLGRPVKPS